MPFCERTESKFPIVKARPEHPISRRDIDADALKVMYRLKNFGHIAYLVGGSVRDLLLGRVPKDFDIGTDATPRQIRKLFRNCFLVGRRFKLAHIRFFDKVIETSTFRRKPEGVDEDVEAADHRLRQDNDFGTPMEDAWRRDFTVNALFYDIRTFSVIDHVGGFEDLKQGIIRCIGDPDLRFKEDPVRMIRAVRFAAKLQFTLDSLTKDAIIRQREAILTAAPSRLMEEVFRLLLVQSSERVFYLLHEVGLLKVLFPEIEAFLNRKSPEVSLFWKMLHALDQAASEGIKIEPALAVSSLIYAPLCEVMRKENQPDQRGIPAPISQAFLQPLAARFQMPRKVFYQALLLLAAQKRLGDPGRIGRGKTKLARQPWFADAVSLLAIVDQASGRDELGSQVWRKLALESPVLAEQGTGLQPSSNLGVSPRKRRKRSFRRRKPSQPKID